MNKIFKNNKIIIIKKIMKINKNNNKLNNY